jgi:hypothetical protein
MVKYQNHQQPSARKSHKTHKTDILPRIKKDAYDTLTTSAIDRNSVLRKLNEFINDYNSGTDKKPLTDVVDDINNEIENENYIFYELQKRNRPNTIIHGEFTPQIIPTIGNNKYRIVLKNADDQSASEGIRQTIEYNNTLEKYTITFNENSNNTGNIDTISINQPTRRSNTVGSRGGKSKVKRNKTKKNQK